MSSQEIIKSELKVLSVLHFNVYICSDPFYSKVLGKISSWNFRKIALDLFNLKMEGFFDSENTTLFSEKLLLNSSLSKPNSQQLKTKFLVQLLQYGIVNKSS